MADLNGIFFAIGAVKSPTATATIYAPNGWWQEYKADAEGNVTLARPWRGQYVIEVIFLEPISGEFEGKAYNAMRHRATLTVKQGNGAETFSMPAQQEKPAH